MARHEPSSSSGSEQNFTDKYAHHGLLTTTYNHAGPHMMMSNNPSTPSPTFGAHPNYGLVSHVPGSSPGSYADFGQVSPLGMSSMSTPLTSQQAIIKFLKERDYLLENIHKQNTSMRTQMSMLSTVHADRREMSARLQAHLAKFESSKKLILSQREKIAVIKEREKLLNRQISDGKLSNVELENLTTRLSERNESDRSEFLVVQKRNEELANEVAEKQEALDEMILRDFAGVPADDKTQNLLDLIAQKTRDNETLTETNTHLGMEIDRLKSAVDQLLADIQSSQVVQKEREHEYRTVEEQSRKWSAEMPHMISELEKSRQLYETVVGENRMMKRKLSGVLSDTAIDQPNHHLDASLPTIIMTTSSDAAVEMWTQTQGPDSIDTSPPPGSEGSGTASISDVLSQLHAERANSMSLRNTVMMQNGELQRLQATLSAKENQLLETCSAANASGDSLQVTIGRLTHDLAEAKLQINSKASPRAGTADIHTLQSQNLTLIKEVHQMQAHLNEVTSGIGAKSQRIHILEDETRKLREEMKKQQITDEGLVQALQNALLNMEGQLTGERRDHLSVRKAQSELRVKFNKVASDYKEMHDTFEKYRKAKENDNTTVPASEHKHAVDRLTAQLIAADEVIALRDAQLSDSKKDVFKLQDEVENVAVLKAQADIFRSDFEAERKEREVVVADKDKILSEMNNLQIQHQQLIDELETYSRTQISLLQERHAQNIAYPSPGFYPPAAPPRPPYPGYPTNAQPRIPHSQTFPIRDIGPLSRSGQGTGPPPQPPHNRGYPAGVMGPPNPSHLRNYPHPMSGTHNTRLSMNIPYPGPTAAHAPVSRSSAAREHSEVDGPYKCPKCYQPFTDSEMLQLHTVDCLAHNS